MFIPRIIFEPLSVQLGQPIIVENRPGAGGTIGTNVVAKAEPDGYTLLAQSSAYTVLPWVYPKLPYDPVRDFLAIIPLGNLPTVLVTSPAKGLTTIGELVAAARAKPGSFNYTSTGIGNATHLNAERFRASAGIAAVHIPVTSGPEALTEIMSGRADFYFCPIGTALPFIRDGKCGALSSALRAGSPNCQTCRPRQRQVCQCGLHPLDRSVRAGEYSTRHRGSALQGDGKHDAVGERTRQAGGPRRRSYADDG
jgi:tripartite-type tricarboxylate transporter receptor subunit TctC